MTSETATVFVVDDDASVRRGLARLLKAFGYRTETFASARDFLEGADLGRVGCLLLDVRMPGQSGLDLFRLLKELGHQLPVIFITGHGDIPMAVGAMKAGAVDFLSKPLDEHVLLDAVEQAIANRRSGS